MEDAASGGAHSRATPRPGLWGSTGSVSQASSKLACPNLGSATATHPSVTPNAAFTTSPPAHDFSTFARTVNRTSHLPHPYLMYSTAASSAQHILPPSPAQPPCGRKRPDLLTLPRFHLACPRQTASHQGGLRTPPTEDMGTTYQPPNLASYESSHRSGLPGYASAMAQADRKRNALSEAQAALAAATYSRPHLVSGQPLSAQIHQPHNRLVLSSSTSSQPLQSSSRHSTRPSTPNSVVTLASQQEEGTSRRDSAMVLHSLEIPACISPKGGNLADFAAQVSVPGA